MAHDWTVTLDDGWIVSVPAGFTTDFASVPRFFWRLVPPWGRYSRAAVVHDFLYVFPFLARKRSETYRESKYIGKREADIIFYRMMEALGVPRWKRLCMFWAVRFFGRGVWGPNERKRKKLMTRRRNHD